MSQFIQYGSGLHAPKTWRNFDASPSLRIQRLFLIGSLLSHIAKLPKFPPNVEYGDIVKGLPLSPGSCCAIYASHVLEHLSLFDFRIAIKHTHSYLIDGGVFRIVMPDLETLVRTYITSNQAMAALVFMEKSGLGRKLHSRSLIGRLRTVIGNSAHHWLWDFKSIKFELSAVGFSNIRRAFYGDSEITQFHDVEEINRWQDCLGIECRR